MLEISTKRPSGGGSLKGPCVSGKGMTWPAFPPAKLSQTRGLRLSDRRPAPGWDSKDSRPPQPEAENRPQHGGGPAGEGTTAPRDDRMAGKPLLKQWKRRTRPWEEPAWRASLDIRRRRGPALSGPSPASLLRRKRRRSLDYLQAGVGIYNESTKKEKICKMDRLVVFTKNACRLFPQPGPRAARGANDL